MSSAKLISDNIFWLLLIWPRSKWTIPKVGGKKNPPHILYLSLLVIHISTWINFKRTSQPNDSLSSYWMSSPPLYFLYAFATAFQNITSVTEEDATSRTTGPSPRPLGGKSGTVQSAKGVLRQKSNLPTDEIDNKIEIIFQVQLSCFFALCLFLHFCQLGNENQWSRFHFCLYLVSILSSSFAFIFFM